MYWRVPSEEKQLWKRIYNPRACVMRYFSTLGRSDCTFQFYIGGRGIGKTYSTLREQWKRHVETGEKYIYLRLTEDEMKLCADADNQTCPYKKLNMDMGWDITFEKLNKMMFSIVDNDVEETLGVAASLLAFKNFRGADFSDYDFIYFDEFIPSEAIHKTPTLKKAGWLFINAYETINRNRELDGNPPVKCIFTANAFSLDSSILAEFDLIRPIQKMMVKGQKRFTDPERSIYVELCEAPEIVDAKKQTALYKAMKNNTRFNNLALDNKFGDEALVLMLYQVNFNSLRPHIQFGDICIYINKIDGSYYAAKRRETCPYHYGYSQRTVFMTAFYTTYKIALMEHLIKFDSIATKLTLDEAMSEKKI